MISQQQRRYTRHLEAFYRLSQAVAHDVNNLLSGILGYSELLLIEPVAEHLISPVKEISNAGKRITTLIRLLSAFGSQYAYHPQTLDLSEVIREIEKFMPRVLGKEVEFSCSKPTKLQPIKGDSVKMKQAIVTLAVEMGNLMPQGGKLSLSVNNSTAEQASAAGSYSESGAYVVLTAVSSGAIAVNEVHASIFGSPSISEIHPEETAFGLPSIFELFKVANGHLVLNSVSEQELSVSIYLPALTLPES